MDEILLRYLGQFTAPVLAGSLALVLAFRRSIRRRHLAALAVVTGLSLLAFFGLLLAGFQMYREGSAGGNLLHVTLVLLAGLFVASGSAVGFTLVLKSFGLAALDDSPQVSKHQQRRRRS